MKALSTRRAAPQSGLPPGRVREMDGIARDGKNGLTRTSHERGYPVDGQDETLTFEGFDKRERRLRRLRRFAQIHRTVLARRLYCRDGSPKFSSSPTLFRQLFRLLTA